MLEKNNRKAGFPIDPVYLERWSARSFRPEAMPEEDLLTMFEAARWAQSASNHQPWRFSYALRDSAEWDKYLGFLIDSNRAWSQNASAIVVVVSKNHTMPTDGSEPKYNRTHDFDTGAATQAFTLQASRLGYIAHPMAGIHIDLIQEGLGISSELYTVECMIAVGRLAPREELPEKYQPREIQSQRKPLAEIVFKGEFKS
ncbi:nitroreductase family protein [Rhizobium sp. KVB221]|uniref:Nitroreductase family protein n=1 Tax=Rhizobium setariae TaxID=2801340 RepID=A0A937CMC6_9HYPH|nr:nitroreductase family protein [Rhizobium setariae]MBL0374165.1 nitroreductase family protein [Rhizobium setariae]